MIDCGGWSAKFIGIECLWIPQANMYATYAPYSKSYPFMWGRANVRGKSAKNTMKRIDSSCVGVVQRVVPTSEPYMLVPLDAIKFDALSVIA